MAKKFFEAVTVGLAKSLKSFCKEFWWLICFYLFGTFYALTFKVLVTNYPELYECLPLFLLLTLILAWFSTFFFSHCYDAVKYAAEHPKVTMAEAWETTKTDSYGDEF